MLVKGYLWVKGRSRCLNLGFLGGKKERYSLGAVYDFEEHQSFGLI